MAPEGKRRGLGGWGGWGTLLGVALCVVAFVAVGFLPTLIAGIASADPTQQHCDALAAGLPRVVPQRLILNVTDENGARLAPDLAARARGELAAALEEFPFGANVTVVVDGAAPGANATTHVVEIQLWLHRRLAPEGGPAQGMMCGNDLLVQEGSDPAFDAWTDAHELGHFFGLPHADGTRMNSHGFRAAKFDRFSPCQEAILARWLPGAPYVPHWAQPDCRATDSSWAVFWESLREGIRVRL